MFLKNLQIKGFKSFAEPADLEFEPGVTVVVGPNGSGKSNVVDAIGWVLGAQAPSAVRSQKMDDVIFAGTEKRPALGRAEVSLTIDNSAGVLPIEFTEVTISRLLFRNGDSEYAINGAPTRLLDIQELLSDSGVGRQQHVIVSQGNIDGVLNARPEDRRLIIEEAAGVLKYRRRKERSERRLASTEANLTRITDLLREVRRQLKPLERQADAARRYGDLVAEHEALRVFLSGREIAGLRSELSASSSTRAELRSAGEGIRAALADLDSRIITAEAELGSLGIADVGDALMRLETLRERGAGQVALLAERRRSIQAALEATVDAAVVASVESEAASLRAEAVRIDSELAALVAGSVELDAAEEELGLRWAAFSEQWGEGVPSPSGEAAVVRNELAALRSAAERTRGDHERLLRRREALEQRLARQRGDLSSVSQAARGAEAARARLHEAVATAGARLEHAEARLRDCERAQREAEADRSAWNARAEALSLALADAHQRAGTERLHGLEGVLGTLADLVEVDPGWTEAFEAATSEALGAVVVADTVAARAAIASLIEGDHRGAVLALGVPAPPGAALGRVSSPAGGDPVRNHVRCAPAVADRRGVEELLDRLLATAVAVPGGWQDAAELHLRHPEQVVLTAEGHRFSAGSWRVGAGGAGATGAALEEATEAASRATTAATEAVESTEAARGELSEARRAHAGALRERDDNEALLARSKDALERLRSDAAETEQELEGTEELVSELDHRHGIEASRTAELEADLPRLDAQEAELEASARAMSEARGALEEAAEDIRSRRTDADVREAAVTERRRYVANRLEQLEQRLEGLEAEVTEAAGRRVLLEARAEAVERLAAFVESRMAVIVAELDEQREARRAQSETARQVGARLEDLRAERSQLESGLEENRALLGRAEVAEAEIRTRLDAAIVALRTELDVEPEVAQAAECPPLPEGSTAASRSRELQRELRAMGPINPLALQEFEELSERHEFLEGQLHDVRQSRRELTKVIRAIDEEIVKVFASAFADVSENFSHLFETLFPGGSGRLRLTEPQDLLNTGIEIDARPSGKNVKKLSLLSGGERSLTALAYLFAVFRSRPSPFYVMDEVEAALDDVNLHRFLELVGEFRASAQLMIVSHQKRTMEAADVLYGVSMEPGGSSKVVAERASEVVDVR